MDQRPPRRSRGGAQQVSRPPAASRPSAEPRGAQLLLFPSAAGLRSALSRRAEATRQMCCARGRLAVLERGGAGVQVHQLLVGSDGAQKPSEWGRQRQLGPPASGGGCEGGRPRAGTDTSPPSGPSCGCAVLLLTGRKAHKGTRRFRGPRWPQKRAGQGGFSRFALAASLSFPGSFAQLAPSSQG